jgi:hypothetical protein
MTPPPIARGFAILGLLVAGCGPTEEVKTYNVARETEKPVAGPVAPGGGSYRILGAMFPADNPTWFFKLTGPADAVGAAEPAFDEFLASVKFSGQKPEYAAPAGWKSGGPESIHADTLVFEAGGKPLKLTVTPAMGGVSSNIGRWAGQVGATGADPVAAYSKPVETKAGAKGIRVDVSGPKNPVGGPMMGGK